MDNHDNARFLSRNSDWNSLSSMIAFNFFVEGIPIFYYGTEQGFKGGNDPQNREPLWTNLDKTHPLY